MDDKRRQLLNADPQQFLNERWSREEASAEIHASSGPTPAMIKAGASVVCELFHEVVASESGIATVAAIEVYQAMLRARKHA